MVSPGMKMDVSFGAVIETAGAPEVTGTVTLCVAPKVEVTVRRAVKFPVAV